MALSRCCVDTLLDLVENKLSMMEITDREDVRERQVLERCLLELKAEGLGQSLAALPFQQSRRRGRRPKTADLGPCAAACA